MPSVNRNLRFNTFHHIYNRGVMKMKIFHEDFDYKIFIGKTWKYSKKYPVDIVCYCIMPNHFHFVLEEIGKIKPIIPSFLQQLQNSYAKYYSKKYNHSGRLFQGTYKSKFQVSEKQLHDTIKYILNNPVKNSLVVKSEHWKWKYLKGYL